MFGATFVGLRVLNGPQYSVQMLNGAQNLKNLLSGSCKDPRVFRNANRITHWPNEKFLVQVGLFEALPLRFTWKNNRAMFDQFL